MTVEQYGLEVRPWPPGCSCHGEGSGYFSDYRSLFDGIVGKEDRYYLYIAQHEAGFWEWQVGSFSWTPDGELWDSWAHGENATRGIAEGEAREAARTCARRLAEAMA